MLFSHFDRVKSLPLYHSATAEYQSGLTLPFLSAFLEGTPVHTGGKLLTCVSKYNSPQLLAHWGLKAPSADPKIIRTTFIRADKKHLICGKDEIFYSGNLRLHHRQPLKPRRAARTGCFLTLMKRRTKTPTKNYTFPTLFSSVRVIP